MQVAAWHAAASGGVLCRQGEPLRPCPVGTHPVWIHTAAMALRWFPTATPHLPPSLPDDGSDAANIPVDDDFDPFADYSAAYRRLCSFIIHYHGHNAHSKRQEQTESGDDAT